jgi:hypothetical protein
MPRAVARETEVTVLDKLRHLLIEEGDQQPGDMGPSTSALVNTTILS